MNPEELRRALEDSIAGIDPTTPSSSKNKSVERLLEGALGLKNVAAKSLSSKKNAGNRLAESLKRRPRSEFGIAITQPDLRDAIVKTAHRFVTADSGYSALLIATRDRSGVTLTDALRIPGYDIPSILKEAFPKMKISSVVEPPHPDRSSGSVSDEEDAQLFGLRPAYSIEDCAAETSFDPKDLATWLNRLRRKKHLVFQGPPGTGKTFAARHLAKLLTAGSRGAADIVQFHPSYAYEDFVQGIRPEVVDGKVIYDVQPGRFLEFCARAEEKPDSPFVLIIDEMNRGNLSRIFGELLYLLEYRSSAVPLAQGGESFSVPDNIHLIGTMNTADRSIALVDHALRRRFSFIYLAPDYALLTRHCKALGFDAVPLVEALRKLNVAIGDRNYQVGISYFLAAGKDLPRQLPEIWQGEIEPYLEEYFFDVPGKAEAFRWKTLAEADLAAWSTLSSDQGSRPAE